MRTVILSLAVLSFSGSALAQQEAGSASAGATASTSATPATADVSVSTETTTEEADTGIPGSLVLGAGVGGIFPQPFSSLGSHVAVALEVGYRLPFLEQRLEIMSGLGYSPPGRSFDVTRTDGKYSGDVTEQELHLSLGVRARLMPRSSPWNVSLGVGPRMFFLKTTSSGSKAGQSFAEYTEKSTQVGVFGVVGGEYVLGPGAIFLDVDLGYAKLPHQITGDASTGNLAALVGYRFFLL